MSHTIAENSAATTLDKPRILEGAALAEATARAVLAQLADLKRMLDEMREQRDKWKAQAERRLAAPAITSPL